MGCCISCAEKMGDRMEKRMDKHVEKRRKSFTQSDHNNTIGGAPSGFSASSASSNVNPVIEL